MFLVRAVFWITVVALMLPHEPDLGLGKPGVLSGALGGLAAGAGGQYSPESCGQYASACAAGVNVLDHFQATALDALARVKTEIEEQQRVREHASGA